MSESTSYSGRVERAGAGRFELLHLTMVLTRRDRALFRKNPVRFVGSFLRANGHKVNGVTISSGSQHAMDRELGRGSGPVWTLVTYDCHVEAPKRYRSNHIMITVPDRSRPSKRGRGKTQPVGSGHPTHRPKRRD